MKWWTVRNKVEDLPKIRNVFLYACACLAKLLAGLLFVLLYLLCIPCFFCLKLFCRRKDSFRKLARGLVSFFCRIFIVLLRCIFFMKLKFLGDDRSRWKEFSSKIVVANHPSILDLPLLLASVPNANLIVGRSGTLPFPFRFLGEAYIASSSWGSLLSECRAVLSRGDCIIVFPEKLLTPRSGTNPYRRTAARLARECGCDIQPIYIGGSDKYGLGSPSAPLSACRTGLYLYELKLLPLISGSEYAELTAREASFAVTKKMHDEISAEAYLSDYRIV